MKGYDEVNSFGEKVSFIWSVADLLRGPYKPAQYGRVILPLTVLRRLDCVLEPTKEKVLAKAAELKGGKVANAEPIFAKYMNDAEFKKIVSEYLLKQVYQQIRQEGIA